MSRPKPGMGRELRRTLGHAKVKVHSSSTGTVNAVQLAPIVSSSSRAAAATIENESSVSAGASTTTALLSHLSLIPSWDTDPHSIVVPYTHGYTYRARLPLRTPPTTAAAAATSGGPLLLAPRPVRLGETFLRRDAHAPAQSHARTYTSSTAPVHHSAMADTFPSLSLPIPPSLMADKFDSSSSSLYTSNHSWPFDFLFPSSSSSSQNQQPPPPLEPGLIPQQPPSPGPNPGTGTVKTREMLETHTVLSPSTPAPQQPASPSHALLTHYALSLPNYQDSHALPTPPDSGALSTYSSSLEFRIGASGLAKIRPPPTPPRSPSSSARERSPPTRSFALPDVTTPSTLHSVQVGEDAYFTRPDAMCIADGVGGWARSGRGGANAARWSRLLTHFVREEIELWWKGDPVYTEPLPSGSGGGGKGKGKKSWSEAWRDAKTKEDDGIGLDTGLRRRKLDAVEIMQRGFEKCLSCVMSEVSPLAADAPIYLGDQLADDSRAVGDPRFIDLYPCPALSLHTPACQLGRLRPLAHPQRSGHPTDKRDAARL